MGPVIIQSTANGEIITTKRINNFSNFVELHLTIAIFVKEITQSINVTTLKNINGVVTARLISFPNSVVFFDNTSKASLKPDVASSLCLKL
ncbi:hypothetical protein FJMB80151_29240 [Enterobacter hormaechei]|nr:hypothetical protein FJMB80144_29240 [Enterobacter hormaechei]BDK41611.1 hypothetical protein FJMB80145_29240 [Enterobacter hormaechei]BDK46820.1 hypothetical protein FJMB80146_29290 [Enterobacter hormaechei]BDK52026.1 hypothetical protein FJMB80151_29240 [Enterobacter hormaechei]BDK57210.1 hypothetical protein FJMB80152_29300 [Enterobacter hormaechei]